MGKEYKMELNLEQRKVVNSKLTGHSLLKGVAGSGKTTVAVCRVPFLARNYCISKDDKVLFVTYNKSLTQYIRYVYHKIKDSNGDQLYLFEHDMDERVEINNIDKIIYSYFQRYKKEKGLDLNIISDRKFLLSIMSETVSEIRKKYYDVKLMDQKYCDFLLKEIEWMKSCEYDDLSVYQGVDRLGRTSNKNDGPQKILKNSRTREAIYETMLLFDHKLHEKKYCTFVDCERYALDYLKEKDIKKYTHIIIDESQDLSKVQIDFLVQLYDTRKEYCSILFVADTAQSIYQNSWLVKGRTFSSIGFDMTGKSNSLAKNYRTTTQIAQAAYSLLSNDTNIISDDNYVKPYLIDRQGMRPVLRGFSTLQDEIAYLKMLVKQLSHEYELRDIAIVTKRKSMLEEIYKSLQDEVKSVLIHSNEDTDFYEDSIKLVTMHSIKGLEFKIVLVVGLCEGVIPDINYLSDNDDVDYATSMERKLLYVGMTRATEKLFLSYHGVPSKFIKDINPNYLGLSAQAKIRSFQSVRLCEYKYQNDICDLYSSEEQIRQWMIRELHETYKYPYELIEVEYKVNLFSKQGSVDIVVNIYRNGEKIPYIFIEVKRKGYQTDAAKKQLQSYMVAEKRCCYGIMTDGNDYVVINNEFEQINDIPEFQASMMPSSIEKYCYKDLKTGNSYTYFIDGENTSEFIVEENGIQEICEQDKLSRIAVFSKIAAGVPITIDGAQYDMLSLPIEWLRYQNQNYILTVCGDSMIEAGINSGDMVVIHKQETADNNDIVAAEIDGEATLKRFTKAGSTVILLPCNSEYEPIILQENQVRILGIAIGLMKQLH